MKKKFEFRFTRQSIGLRGFLNVLFRVPNFDKLGNPINSNKKALEFIESLSPDKRSRLVCDIEVKVPKKINGLNSLLILLHELGHYHNRDFLYSCESEGPEEYLRIEVEAWAYAFQAIKPKYYEEALEFLTPSIMNHVHYIAFKKTNSLEYFEFIKKFTFKYMLNWIREEVEKFSCK